MLLSAVRAFDGTSRVCRYKAPELLVDRPRYTEKVDCWSLGVIFFVMLSGGLPFYDDETGDMDSKVIKGEYYFDAEEWDHVSDSAKDFIRQILVVDPKQRPSCEEMLQHKYGKPASLRVLAGAPVHSPCPPCPYLQVAHEGHGPQQATAAAAGEDPGLQRPPRASWCNPRRACWLAAAPPGWVPACACCWLRRNCGSWGRGSGKRRRQG